MCEQVFRLNRERQKGVSPDISSEVSVMNAKIVLVALTLASIGGLVTASR